MIIKVVYNPVKLIIEEGSGCTQEEAEGVYNYVNQVFSNVCNYLVETKGTTNKLVSNELQILRGSEVTRINLKNCLSVYVMNDDGKTIDSIQCR